MTEPFARTAVGAPLRRPERRDDAEFLYAVFEATQGEVLSGLDPALADVLLRHLFSGQSATYRAAFPAGRFDIVEVDGEAVGRIITDATGGALRLVDVALLPDWRNRGLGMQLLSALQGEARGAGVPLCLSVLRSNSRACRFYERLGFRPTATRETHLSLEWMP